MSIAEQVTRIENDKANIQTALVNKGIAAASHNMDQFAADIMAIPSAPTIPQQGNIKYIIPIKFTMPAEVGGTDCPGFSLTVKLSAGESLSAAMTHGISSASLTDSTDRFGFNLKVAASTMPYLSGGNKWIGNFQLDYIRPSGTVGAITTTAFAATTLGSAATATYAGSSSTSYRYYVSGVYSGVLVIRDTNYTSSPQLITNGTITTYLSGSYISYT